jgi:hypothetical protein
LKKFSLKPDKDGKHKNALSYPYSHPNINQNLPSYPKAVMTPLVSEPGEKREGTEWLDEQRAIKEKALVATNTRVLTHYQLVFDKYDELISRLLMDLAVSARWNRWNASMVKLPRIYKKQGQEINGWGWVVYRVHSSGEAVLPDQPDPHNYTLFNFWQISFTNGHHPDLSPDLRLWHLHAVDILEDFERLMPGQVEKWLKEQLYMMYESGCLWVALPDLLNEKGKRRKPTIEDALHTYNILSYGRNYDPYQTEKHFYDRPPYQNQFVPGYFKR